MAEAGDWREAAAFMGPAYLRYSFTKGTDAEVDFLAARLGLGPATRVLDVGCGPGRHVRALRARGIPAVGVDLAEAFAALAGGSVAVGDAAALPVRSGQFDAVWSLCQGGFGLEGVDDGAVLAQLAAAVRPGGVVVVSAFSAYFALRDLDPTDEFDADRGVNREPATIRDATGREAGFALVTGWYTPRELRLLAAAAGLDVVSLWSVGPGDYRDRPPDVDHPEWLLVARRPAPPPAGTL